MSPHPARRGAAGPSAAKPTPPLPPPAPESSKEGRVITSRSCVCCATSCFHCKEENREGASRKGCSAGPRPCTDTGTSPRLQAVVGQELLPQFPQGGHVGVCVMLRRFGTSPSRKRWLPRESNAVRQASPRAPPGASLQRALAQGTNPPQPQNPSEEPFPAAKPAWHRGTSDVAPSLVPSRPPSVLGTTVKNWGWRRKN